MRHLKKFSLFESAQGLTPKQVEFLDEYTDGTWSVNPSTGLVDVEGDFDCSLEKLKNFKGVKFGRVSGSFDCSSNPLRILEGAPQEVGGDFSCHHSSLQTLRGVPKIIGGDFDCSSNPLRSLEGAPQEVGEDFDCSKCGLTSLEGLNIKILPGSFFCTDNNLKSLVGSPESVGDAFYCYNNSLTNLVGAPETVGSNFSVYGNDLESLEGAPLSIGGMGYRGKYLEIYKDEWNLLDLIRLYKKFIGKRKSLLKTIVSPEALQKRIDQNPEKMIILMKEDLREILATPGYENLKFPQNLQPEIDLLSDLSGVGL